MKQLRPTVADLQALKGKRQLTKLRVETLEEAEAAERAEINVATAVGTTSISAANAPASSSALTCCHTKRAD